MTSSASLHAAIHSGQSPRWFAVGLRFFAVGALVAAAATLLLWLPQMRVLAAIALVQALLGVAVCAWGLRGVAPSSPDAEEASAHFRRAVLRPNGRSQLRRLTHMIVSYARAPFAS